MSTRPWQRLRTAAVATSLAVACSFATLPAQASTATAVPRAPVAQTTAQPADVLRIWTAANEGAVTVTREQALVTARTHDVITAQPKTYATHLAAMRAANPALKIYVYVNATYSKSPKNADYPAEWFSHDASGQRITSKGYGNYLMRPDSPGWRANRMSECTERVTQSGYDGCMLDMLGIAPLGEGYGSGVPVNPTTGTVWTRADWLAATSALTGAVRSSSGRPVIGNGLGNGTRYWAADGPTRVLLADADTGIAESWLRTAGQSLTTYPREAAWKAAVDQLADAGSRGRQVAVMVKLWANGTDAQKQQWHRFSLASFLLGTDGQALYSASFRHGDAGRPHPWWATDLGAPAGPYARYGNVYSRSFAKGVVVVNPTTSPVTVKLDRTYRMLGGTSASSLTVAPVDAVIALD